MSNDETEIVRKARHGDRAAFEELVCRTSRLVFARLYLECGNAARAEDLVQETYLRAMQWIRMVADETKFRPWLLTIAKNVLLEDAKKAGRQKRTSPEQPRSPPGELSPPQMAEREETRQQVLTALRSLPEEYQLPLSLRYLAGADYETISTQLGLTNGSLRGLLHRGLKQLREKLPADLLS